MPSVTTSFDGKLLKQARMIAAEQETSLTGLVRAHLQRVTELQTLFSRSDAVVGNQTWSRDDLYARPQSSRGMKGRGNT